MLGLYQREQLRGAQWPKCCAGELQFRPFRICLIKNDRIPLIYKSVVQRMQAGLATEKFQFQIVLSEPPKLCSKIQYQVIIYSVEKVLRYPWTFQFACPTIRNKDNSKTSVPSICYKQRQHVECRPLSTILSGFHGRISYLNVRECSRRNF